jgi:hypothetical protein
MNEVLREKLEVFIRKYYANRLMKGIFYGLGLGAAYYLLITLLELVGRFSGSVRAALFFTLVAGLLVIVGNYIIIPLSKLVGIGKRLAYKDAARIIGRHFPEVDDKLINTLQLQDLSAGDSELIRASVDQRIAELQPVPFQSAIDLRQNKKYWPLLVIPILIFGGIALSGNWEEFNQSSRRIAEFNREFVPEAPFSFVLENEEMTVEEGEDIDIVLGFSGSSLPTESYILINGRENRMSRRDDGKYHFRLSNLKRDLRFRFDASGWQSQAYEVKVIPVPRIRNINVSVIPPAYTGIKAFVSPLKPVLDIPEGSRVSWQMDLDQSEKASLIIPDGEELFKLLDESRFVLEKRVTLDLEYSVKLKNEHLEKVQIKDHRLDLIPDQYPEIKAVFTRDSSVYGKVFLEGSVADDYGFSRLEMILEVDETRMNREMTINRNVNSAGFADLLLLDSLTAEDSKEIRVFVRVWDNDGVNGAKYATSNTFQFRLKGRAEKEQELEEKYKEYLSGSSDVEENQKELEKRMSEMQKELQGKKNLDWQDKSKLRDLLNKQQELLKQQQQREQELKELQKKEKELGKKNEELEKKEEDINEITPENKELQELMKEIEELMEKLNTEQLMKKLEKMQEMNEQNQQAMERKDELLKDLQFQKDVLQEAQKLKDLGKKMKELSKDLKDENGEKATAEEEMKKQKEIEEEFEKSMEKIEELREENSAFDKQAEKEELEEQQEQTESEMQKAQENMEKQESSPANENQQNAGEKMEEMSESLQMAMMNMQSQQNKENMETLRQILENLKTLSFSIEDLSQASRRTGKNDPAFKELLTEQKRLQDGSRIIEDSLTALGKRVPELEQVVFQELAKINKNLDEGIQHLEELQSAQASANQQMVMTSANNLALLLDETMQSMMQAQAQMMKGNQNCQKPGGGSPKPSMQNMRKMQGDLGKKMDQMKQGNKEGKGKKGERMSKEIVEMLSRQEQIRQALEGMMKDAEGQGTKGDMQKAIDEMKKLEQDLWDGELKDNYKERLKNIDTRLLESEKAELKQKKEKRRESESARDQKQLYEQELEKYLKEKGIEKESLERVPVNFRLYYRNQATDYLKSR